MYLTFLVSRLSHIYNRAELDLQLLALLDRPLVATWPGPRALGLKGVSSLHSHSPPPHPPPLHICTRQGELVWGRRLVCGWL